MLWGKLKVNRQPQYMINMEKTTSGNWHMLKYNQNWMTVYWKKIIVSEVNK